MDSLGFFFCSPEALLLDKWLDALVSVCLHNRVTKKLCLELVWSMCHEVSYVMMGS